MMEPVSPSKQESPDLLTIRPMAAGDVDTVCDLERRCFLSPWSRENIERHALRNRATCYYVAEQASAVVAYAGMCVKADEAHIVTVAVADTFRRQGIASRLLVTLLAEARRSGAETVALEYRPSNEAAARLYAKFGFEVVAVRRNYYRDSGEDAIVAVLRDLDAPALRLSLDELQPRRVVNDQA